MQRLDPRQKSGADVRRMFDAIAPRYDLLNRVLSAGSDVRWRRLAVARALAGLEGALVADACCGTGDLAIELARDARTRRVVGFDFAQAMLARAHAKRPEGAKADFAVADALKLPARSGSFDAVTVAFGLRNVVEPRAGIAELCRLLRPGGRLIVLEFFTPEGGFCGSLFRAYFRHVLPRIGRLVARGAAVDAYRYLPESVESFARVEEVANWFAASGCEEVCCERLLFGAVGLISGVKRVAAGQAAGQVMGTTRVLGGLTSTSTTRRKAPVPYLGDSPCSENP